MQVTFVRRRVALLGLTVVICAVGCGIGYQETQCQNVHFFVVERDGLEQLRHMAVEDRLHESGALHYSELDKPQFVERFGAQRAHQYHELFAQFETPLINNVSLGADGSVWVLMRDHWEQPTYQYLAQGPDCDNPGLELVGEIETTVVPLAGGWCHLTRRWVNQ